jgi:hypothetical protein
MLPAAGIVVGVLLGRAMPAVDAHTRPRLLKVTARTRRT